MDRKSDYRKWVDVGLRCVGLHLLYNFFGEVMTLINLAIGYGELRSNALREVVLFGLLDLMAGIYLLFFPKNIVAKIVRDRDSGALDLQGIRSHQLLLEIGIKLFGVYLFYLFMYHAVTSFNVAIDTYNPGNVEAAGHVVQAVFHLLVSLVFMLKTGVLIEIIYKKDEPSGS